MDIFSMPFTELISTDRHVLDKTDSSPLLKTGTAGIGGETAALVAAALNEKAFNVHLNQNVS
jgi:hypothetical protein